MSVASFSLAEVLRRHVTLEVECIDRMYLNVYIANLHREAGVSWFLKLQGRCLNLQAKFSLTRVLVRPLNGQLFFETAVRENFDPGRPE